MDKFSGHGHLKGVTLHFARDGDGEPQPTLRLTFDLAARGVPVDRIESLARLAVYKLPVRLDVESPQTELPIRDQAGDRPVVGERAATSRSAESSGSGGLDTSRIPAEMLEMARQIKKLGRKG
jgi:hypothetical protein